MLTPNMLSWSLFLLLTPLTTATPIKSTTAANCDRAILSSAADSYIDAQTAGSLTSLESYLASNWTYTENNKVMPAADGVLTNKALKIDHRRTIYDLETCATYTELISTGGPYVIGTQIRHSTTNTTTTTTSPTGSEEEEDDNNNNNSYSNAGNAAEPGKIISIDTIATTTKSWLFNATKTLQYVEQESWSPIPAAQRDSRSTIQAAGDAYLDMWSSETAQDKVPWGTPCVRLEGSAYTGSGSPDDSCTPGIPSNHNQAPNTRRRYVVDVEMGSVSIFCVWEHMMNAADSHEFRLENGKLRYVHTMTECGGQQCRL